MPSGKPFSGEIKLKVLEMRKAGKKVKEISKELGVSVVSIVRWSKQTGQKFPRGSSGLRFDAGKQQRFVDLYEQGLTVTQIEAETGVSDTTIRKYLSLLVNRKPKSLRKTKAFEVKQIQKLHADGMARKAIAKRMGIPVETVYYYCRQKRKVVTREEIEICLSFRAHLTQADAAKKIGVSTVTFRRYLKLYGLRWK